jgi:threonine aldolase
MLNFISDTVTIPTKEMLRDMMQAKVGDDVFASDPTVNALQTKAAELFGVEQALFCPSGTLTNQIAIAVHTDPGDEVICSYQSHIYNFEGGGIARNSGAQVRLVGNDSGILTADDVQSNINPSDSHYTNTSLVSIENTTNRGGGKCYQLEEVKAIANVCRENGLKYHLDGARLFNALVAKNETASDYGVQFDSISICLSKGLGAPVGSLLLGSEEFINKAHRVRKVMGGGMRQAGYLAAAGIYALNNNIERLADDHARAKYISDSIQEAPYIVSTDEPETNILMADLSISSEEYLKKLENDGMLAIGFGPKRIRITTHLDVSEADVEKAISIMKNLV